MIQGTIQIHLNRQSRAIRKRVGNHETKNHNTTTKHSNHHTVKTHENLQFLCESGCFADAIGWHYERDIKANGYIAETGRMNPDTEIIVTVYLGVGEGVIGEEIDMALSVTEEE